MSAASLNSLPPKNRKDFIESLTHDEIQWILHSWPFWARADQMPPRKPWTTWLILGGRGAGKTRAGAEWIRQRAEKMPLRIALLGETYLSARDVMVEGASGLLNIAAHDKRPVFHASRRTLQWRSGATAQLFSAEEPDALRGPQFHAAWCDELCKWRYADASWNMLQFALRLGKSPQQVVTTTPRSMPLLKTLLRDPHCVVTRASTYQNRANLAESFFDQIIKRYEGTRLGRQELNAELVEDDPDALWSRDILEAHRVLKHPALRRAVVAVDPPASATPKADECGIIAAALGEDGHAYILGDYSAKALSPARWAKRAVQACRTHHTNTIVAEINQGGDMVESVIRQVAPDILFRPVRAHRGKRLRAEPVAALYEQGKVHHVGAFPQLEDQMCAFTGSTKQDSPDRMDALVWAVSFLLLGGRVGVAKMRAL